MIVLKTKTSLVEALQKQSKLDGTGQVFFDHSISSNSGKPSWYEYNEANGSLTIHDGNSSTHKGCLTIPVGYLLSGDVVEVECELMAVDGVKPKIALDIFSKESLDPTSSIASGNEIISPCETTKMFELVKVKLLNKRAGYGKIVIGLFTADTGEYRIRNVIINRPGGSGSSSGSGSGGRVKTNRMYNFRQLELMTVYGDDRCSIERKTDSEGHLCVQVNHEKPFTCTDQRGIAIATNNGSSGNPFNIEVRARSEQHNYVQIRFIDRNSNKIIDPNDIDELFWWGVIHYGYDYE